MEDPVEVELARMTLDSTSEVYLLYLRVVGQQRMFRISVGPFEAAEIRRKVSGDPVKRPMPHDLIGRVLAATEHTLERVVITELRDETFFACLHLSGAHGERVIDCRPSDGIALAIQRDAKIYVAPEVLDAVATE